jgi:RNA polymerase sigma factor (sigma-70 family)
METLCAPRPSTGNSFPAIFVSCIRTPEDETAFLESWDADLKRSARANARIANLIDGEADDLAQEARIKLLALCRGRKITAPHYVRTAIKNSMLRARSRIRGKCNRPRPEASEVVTECLPSGRIPNLEEHSIIGMQAQAPTDSESEFGGRKTAASVLSDDLRITAQHLEFMSVRQWIRQLPDRLKRIYDSIYVRGLSQREAATFMRISQPRVSQLHLELLRRGRAELTC